ncbi:MAG TPA: NADH dehydrogenase (quinone) subunit G [Actinobacteria bacterium]|nr:NADH dehydrogenase (quinone) subunit G [Actinomycetota bacterium]
MTDLVKVTVDGQEFEVPKGQLVIDAAIANGTYIPHFCYHPRLDPVGKCRMCLIELETPRGAVLTTACTLEAADGMVVHTKTPVVEKAREGVLEFLLINHPLDCPICDKGGECPLQDQTLGYGPGESRFVEEKRHFEKPIPVSDLVLLDRERCIFCWRCIRFAEEVAGDPLIEFTARGNNNHMATFPNEPFASYFSGNTVQICPVGALTAVPYRFKARPWDLQKAESTCHHCTVGDSIEIDTSRNRVLRFNGVDNDATNQGWLSDKCRFGFEFIGSEDRLEVPLIRNEDGSHREASWAEALDVTAARLEEIIEAEGGAAVAGLGGARGTNEDAYAFSKFMRTVVGSNHVDAQMDDGLDPRLLAAPDRRARISDLDAANAILVWAPDLKEEVGTLYLRVRQAAQKHGAQLVVVHPRRTGLDDRTKHKITYRPGQGPEVLRALAAGEGEFAAARSVLGEGPVVAIIGRTGLTEDPRLAESVAAFALTLPDAKIMPLVRRSNVYGALDMGLAPRLLPGRVSLDDADQVASFEADFGAVPDHEGRDARGILEGLVTGELKALVMVGADPVRDVPDGALAAEALDKAEFVVALDLFLTDSSARADVVLPVEAFAEKEGTATNLEGRVQKVTRVVAGPGQTQPDWSILEEIARRLDAPMGFDCAKTIAAEIAEVAPAYTGVTWSSLAFGDGVVIPGADADQPLRYTPVDHALESVSAPLVLHLARTLYDDGVEMRRSLSLHHLAPGASAHLHPLDAASLGVVSGDEVSVQTPSTTVVMPAVLDASLVEGVVYVPFNQPEMPPLGDQLAVTVRKEVSA